SDDVGELITFDGTASSDPDGSSPVFAWTFTSAPAGSAATLTSIGNGTATFRPDVPGVYTAQLTAFDGQLSSTSSTTATAVAVTVTNAGQTAAQPSATLQITDDIARLDWLDAFPAGATYRIERQNADGTYRTVEILAGAGGGLAPLSWQQAYTTP